MAKKKTTKMKNNIIPETVPEIIPEAKPAAEPEERPILNNVLLFLSNQKFITYILILCIVIFFAGAIGIIWISRDLPTPGKLINADKNNTTRIFDRNGTLLYSFYLNENRTYVSLDKVPKYLQEGTIAIEDKNFYQNPGFSVTGMARAVRNMLLGYGVQGGSTITQELIKNVLLTPQQTISRKVKELILAIEVTQTYSKNQILEMYLNDIGYGGPAVGVEAAAQEYFGKNVTDLDLAQSAFLAGLPQSPTYFSPFGGHKYYVARTDNVLIAMENNGYITKQQEQQALAEITTYKFSSHDLSLKAPHFVMYIKSQLVKMFGEDTVESGGLQVTTTLDYPIEKKAEDIVKNEVAGLKADHVTNGAAVIRDPKTGEILAMVGSVDYFNKANDGSFNAALAQRQPGSSLKPIMYSVAFAKGYTPATTVMDVPTDFQTNAQTPAYRPVDYDLTYAGPVQLRFALGNSLNIPAVKMLAKVGIKPVMQQAYNMGISNWKPTPQALSQVGLSLVLGGRETNLLDETTAYSVFATGGIRHDPVSILKVTDPKGTVLYHYEPNNGKRVLSEDVSFLISHILLDNNARTLAFGPHSWLVIPGQTVSVKTGTTDQKRDNWTVGYTPSYVVGVWVGNNNNTPMNPAIASGITGASPIWNKIMSYVLKGKPNEQPKKPDNIMALQIDALFGGLPVPGQPTRSEYFIKGTEPTKVSPNYKIDGGKLYYDVHETDPVSKDGVDRWQLGIDEWIHTNHSAADWQWYPPGNTIGQTVANLSPTPTP
ncbi:MAG TPA: transglycosylase domain-containing protein [Candidatus Acidoferrales bacterium]|nr:transglycosylase domain-containing protein [Candidatus Acidoferrales bacterium]